MKNIFKVMLFVVAVSFFICGNAFGEEDTQAKFKKFEKKGTVEVISPGVLKAKIPEKYRDGDIRAYIALDKLGSLMPRKSAMTEDGTCIVILGGEFLRVLSNQEFNIIIDYGKDDKGAVYGVKCTPGNDVKEVMNDYEFSIAHDDHYYAGKWTYYLKYSYGPLSAGLMRKNAYGESEYLGIHDIEKILYADENTIILEKKLAGKTYISRVDLNMLKETKTSIEDGIVLGVEKGDVYYINVKNDKYASLMKVSGNDNKKVLVEDRIKYDGKLDFQENFHKNYTVLAYISFENIVSKEEAEIKEEDKKIKEELGIKEQKSIEMIKQHMYDYSGTMKIAPNYMGKNMRYTYYHDGNVYVYMKDGMANIVQEKPCKIIRRDTEKGEDVVIQEGVIFREQQSTSFQNIEHLLYENDKLAAGGIVVKKVFKDEDRWAVIDYIKEQMQNNIGKGSKVLFIESTTPNHLMHEDLARFSAKLREDNKDAVIEYTLSGKSVEGNKDREITIIEMNFR